MTGQHRDSGERAALDQTIAALVEFTDKAGLTEQMRNAVGSKNHDELQAGARRHERRQTRR
jgi:hypothetical protein